MSWLSVITSGNKVPVIFGESEQMLKVFGDLKSQTDTLRNRNIIDILDSVTAEPDAHRDIVDAINRITKHRFDNIAKTWRTLKQRYDSESMLKLRALAKRLDDLKDSELPTSVEWRLFRGDVDNSRMLGSAGIMDLGVLVSASIDFEAHATAPVLPAHVTPPELTDMVLVRMGLDANVEVNGRAAFGFNMFNTSVGAGVAGKTDVDIYFTEDPSANFGSAIAENFADLIGCSDGACSPFKVDDILRLCVNDGLYCLKFSAESRLGFDASFGVGRNVAVGNSLNIGATISVESRITEMGRFDYTLCLDSIDGERAIFVEVMRADESERQDTSALAIEIDPRAYFKAIDGVIKQRLGKAQAVFDEFTELLPGQGFVNEKINDLIDDKLSGLDDDDRESIKVLLGASPDSKPEDVLKERIISAIESSVDTWSTDVETAVDSITYDVLSSLKQYFPVSASIESKITDAVKDTLVEKQDALKKSVAAKVTDNNQYQSLAKLLNDAGARISETTSDFQRELGRLTDTVQGLLNRLQKRIARIKELIDVATEKTITLEMKTLLKQSKSERLHLQFALFPERGTESCNAQHMLEHILHGELDRAISRVRDLATTDRPCITVIDESGGYSVYENLLRDSGTNLALWNFNIQSNDILEEELSMNVGVDGTVTISSSAEYSKINQKASQKRIVRFFDAIEMISTSNRNSIHAGLTISREDEQFDNDEASEYLHGMQARGLIRQSTVSKVMQLLDNARARGVRRARIDMGISFSRKHLSAMFDDVDPMTDIRVCDDLDHECKKPLAECGGRDHRKGCEYYLNELSEIVAEVLLQHHSDQRTLGLVERFVEQELELDGGLAEGIRFMTPKEENKYVDEYIDEATFLEYRRHGIMAFYDIVSHLKSLSELTIDANGNVKDTTLAEVRARQHWIGQLMALWWQWDISWKQWFFLTDKMRALNIALFECLTRLARGRSRSNSPPLVWLSLTQKNERGVQETRVVTDID